MNTMTNEIDPSKDPAARLPEVEKMLHSLAWKTARSTPISYEDAISEAYWLYMKACRLWDPAKAKGKFSSFVYMVVSLNLKTLIANRMKDPCIPTEINDDLLPAPLEWDEHPAEDKVSRWSERLGGLSEDAREILSLIIESPREILEQEQEMIQSPKALLRQAKRFLQERRGMHPRKIKEACQEIELRFAENWI